MRIILWDTKKSNASKDFAGGFGVGKAPRLDGPAGKIISHFYRRDRRPTTLTFAYLAAIFRKLGHEVKYAVDREPTDADLYVFCPSLISLSREIEAMRSLRRKKRTAKILVVGATASTLPKEFDDDVIVVRGEAERLLWKFDEARSLDGGEIDLGIVEDLDDLPYPDWSPFSPHRFRVSYEFRQFPTAYVQSSRGCRFHCNYCPYVAKNGEVRQRSPELVVEEMQEGIKRWDFRSFKFRDPLFGLEHDRVERFVELIGKLPKKIEFSIESRIELLPRERLIALRKVGLSCVTVGLETPDEATLKKHHRVRIAEERQIEFIEECRRLGIRTVGGFIIGFPDDDEQAVRRVGRFARELNPTFANFNVVTPYPGTPYYDENRDAVAHFDFSQYSSYEPVLKNPRLSDNDIKRLHSRCFRHFYFRWNYFRANGVLLWPFLAKLLPLRTETVS